jgi:phosphonate transport system substrate-binding protein
LVDRSEDPFSLGEADVGFLCAPTYLRLREREHPPAELLGAAPVFADERARGKPVYFCDVIVHRNSPARSFRDLKGKAWAYNDPCSLSGYGGLAAKLGSPEAAGLFFGRTIRSGSHPASVELVAAGEADAASIDSNVLRIMLDRIPSLRKEVRVLESWGPYPIQPVVVRTDLDPALKGALCESLLRTEADPLTRVEFEAFRLKRFVTVGEEDYGAGRLPQALSGR